MNSIGRVAIASVALSLTLVSSFSAALAETKTYGQQPAQTRSAAAATGAAGSADKPTTAQGTKGSEIVALQGPKQIVQTQTAKGWQQNSAYITIKQGQDILPLTLSFTNGAGNAAKLSGIRVTLNGRKLVTEADFKGQDKISLNMTNLLSSGDTQMLVQTFGPAGATLEWVLTTGKIKVTGLKPEGGAPGDRVTISGKNLPKQASAYQLFVGKTAAIISNITDKSLDFVVPSGVGGGNVPVTLYIAGVKCDPMNFKLKAAPEVFSVNMVDATPASTISISGKGFSKVVSENEVTVGGTPCQVLSASESTIDAMIPNSITCPQMDCPVLVKTNGQAAKLPQGNVTVNVTMREIRKGEGFAPGSQPTN